MSRNTKRRIAATGGVGTMIAAMALAAPARAQTANTTAADVNVLNLLSPFLSLNGTTVGQQTLTTNLNSAVTVNQFAASTPVVASTSISDKTIFGGASTAITLPSGASASYGPGANLGGGLPVQQVQSTGGYAPYQQYGGLGTLGPAYQAAVSPSGAAVPSVVSLLSNAYNFTSSDLGIAKFYFANGTTNGTTAAVAPSGFTLPLANFYPNLATSVYDTAYGVSISGANQDIYGSSRPSQVAPSRITGYDPTALTGLASNPSFPSGHTTYAFTDSILIGMLAPQFYQSMLLRGSEYGNSRISLGVHYPLDIIASRSFVSYDLAQLLNATGSAYTQTNAVTGATAQNINSQFQTAATALNSYLNTQTGSCGGSLAACAANNPYNSYSAATYGGAPLVGNAGATTAAINSAIYQSRLTYGLPTLSFAQAPREQAPAGGPDASILLATVYGGSSTAAQSLAGSVGGALYGNLSTGTINQIIVNTETNALAAFYGTPLSYWSRLDLYDAAGYFQNVTGSIFLAPTDQLKSSVVVANTGAFGGSGTITGNVLFQAGGALAAQGNGTGANAPLTVNGAATFQAGSKVLLTGTFLPGQPYSLLNTTGKNPISIDPSVTVDTSTSGNLMQLFSGTLAVVGDPTLTVRLQSNFAAAATTSNQRSVAGAIDAAGNAGTYGANGAALISTLIQNNTVASAPAAFDALSGEGIAAQQQAAFDTGDLFARTTLAQATFQGNTDSGQTGLGSPIRTWATGFGRSDSLSGNRTDGTAAVSTNAGGFAAGGDYLVTPGLTVGAAAGYSSTNFANPSRATTGGMDAGHVAVYGVQQWSPLYLAGLFEYAHYSANESRTVLGAGQQGNFGSNEFLGRVETGYGLTVSGLNTTPFAGFQAASLGNDAFGESGSSLTGLNVRGTTVSSDKAFLGVQLDRSLPFGIRGQVTPFVRAAWEHEFDTRRNLSASLQALPGPNFTVLSAAAADDLARIDAGLRVNLSDRLSVFAEFDGAFTGIGNSYAGRGGLKLAW